MKGLEVKVGSELTVNIPALLLLSGGGIFFRKVNSG